MSGSSRGIWREQSYSPQPRLARTRLEITETYNIREWVKKPLGQADNVQDLDFSTGPDDGENDQEILATHSHGGHDAIC